MTSPTVRSIAHLKETGWVVDKVEHFNTFAHRTFDLFGCIDIVAIRPGELAGIQTTSDDTGGNSGERRRKILAEPRMRQWLEAGGTLYLHAWAKRGAQGKRKTWQLVVNEPITLAHFDPIPCEAPAC